MVRALSVKVITLYILRVVLSAVIVGIVNVAKILETKTICTREEAIKLLKTYGFRKNKDTYHRKRKIHDVSSEKEFSHDKATLTEEGIAFTWGYKES